MKNVKVSELKVGDIFTESMQLKNRESFTVELIQDGYVYSSNNNSRKEKKFRYDQEKQVILLKEL